MQMSEFRQARDFARRYGCKSVCFGPPGAGKTPIMNTAPRPLLAVTEPGMLSMRKSTIPAVELYTPERIDDFFKWLTTSAEVKNFDTIGIDSGSHAAEIYLDKYLGGKSKAGNKVDGKAAYGDMSRAVMAHMNELFFLPQKHVYIICKQMRDSEGQARPFFPGQDLNVKVPHMFDLVMQLNTHSVPNVGQVKAFRCLPSYEAFARDRSGNLAEFEPPDLTGLFNKVML